MPFDRKPFVWEVPLQAQDGKTLTEKVHSAWAPGYPGTKDAVACAGRCSATSRNKGKVQFQNVGDPTLLGRLGDEGAAA